MLRQSHALCYRAYAGMYQRERTEAEQQAFRTAISQMQLLYAHKKTLVYMLTTMPQWTVAPSGVCKEYHERGWVRRSRFLDPLAVRGRVRSPHLFCHRVSPAQPTFERRMAFLLKMQSSLAWANVVDVGNPDATRLVPLTPKSFEELLETRKFTNGADHGTVLELYRKTIEEALSQTTELRFVKQGWRDADVAVLCEVLPLCRELRCLALDDNKLTSSGAKMLANALTAGATPQQLRDPSRGSRLHMPS